MRLQVLIQDVHHHIPSSMAGFEDASNLLTQYLALLRFAGATPEKSETLDREDWIEKVARIVAISAACEQHQVALFIQTSLKSDPIPANTIASAMGKPSIADPLVLLTPMLRAGLEDLAKLGYKPIAPFEQPVPYGLNPGFVRNAGREFVACKHEVDDIPMSLAHLPLLSDVAKRFIGRKVAWKMLSEPLKEYSVIPFTPTAEEPLPEEICWASVHRATGVSAIQEFVEMEQEYRCFVVNGRVVSGAGAVVEYTPLNRTASADEIFDYAVRTRISGKEPPAASIVVSAYRDAAQDIVDEITTSDPTFPRHFVMDLFATANDRSSFAIGVVELNPLGRSGFFANDPHRIADAMLTWLKSNPNELSFV